MPDDLIRRSSLLAALRKDVRWFWREHAVFGVPFSLWAASYAALEVALTAARHLAPHRKSAPERFIEHALCCLMHLELTVSLPTGKRAA